MTPRQRVLAAIAHQEPDRVPIDQGSMRSASIMVIAYNRLKAYLGVQTAPPLIVDLVQQLAQPEPWYLDRFHVDATDLGHAFTDPAKYRPWRLPDGSPALVPEWFRPEPDNGGWLVRTPRGAVMGRMPASFVCFDQSFWPLAGPDGLDGFEPLEQNMDQVVWAGLPSPPFEEKLTDRRLEEIERGARRLRGCSDRAVAVSVGCNLLEWSQILFGMENTYLYMAGEKRKYLRFLDRLTEVHLEKLHRLLPRLRGLVDFVVAGDDLGMQSGPQMSRAMYRELFFPRHRRLYTAIRQLSGAHLMLHCCGGVEPLLGDLIEAGVEIFNPVQTSARHMEPERLKRQFGRDLTFWGGGVDTQWILPRGTPEQVREDVKRRIEVFAPGGGFVWAPVHNILADVPPQNVVAALEAAYEFG